jgi:hypothetical protein
MMREVAMILVRDVFQIQPEHMRAVKDTVRDLRALGASQGYPISRILTDLTGEYYTLVLESEFLALADFEQALRQSFASSDWQKRYASLRPLIRGGRREVFQIME